jgi:hypothetical protein
MIKQTLVIFRCWHSSADHADLPDGPPCGQRIARVQTTIRSVQARGPARGSMGRRPGRRHHYGPVMQLGHPYSLPSVQGTPSQTAHGLGTAPVGRAAQAPFIQCAKDWFVTQTTCMPAGGSRTPGFALVLLARIDLVISLC